MKLTFIGSEKREGDARSFLFKADEPVKWTAGQYLYYTLDHDSPDDRGNQRWFTISSAPSERHIMITTRINPERGSSFKHALAGFKPGDQIEAEEPEGDFVIEDPSRNYIFVAGGIGITPFRSILTEAAAQGQQLNVQLLYANRSSDIVFKEELDQLQASNPKLKIRYIVDPERLDEAVLKSTTEATDNPLVYVSGPEPMVEALTKQIAKLGVSEDNIRGDYFPGYEALGNVIS
jgi:ferredoxin-NADP reductase